MTTLEIDIPDDVNRALEQFSQPKEEIVLNAVKIYLSQQETEKLEILLKEGYLAGREENVMLMQEFKTADLSNWDY